MAYDGSVLLNTKLDNSGIERDLAGMNSIVSKGVGAAAATFATLAVAAGAAFTALAGKALAMGGDLEQSIGGIETLFKNSADAVIANSERAYLTAGVNANDYMQQVTSFSASLLQSLGGDTEAAARVADMAVIDMSDNANKMGTSVESIQNAYQGFAKQNYTMLDNLKLGFGGTKQEMQRLLEEAGKISGIDYDISNLADVYEAIHVIQTELGITGTTALEGMETLNGAAATAKAAWSNFLSGAGGVEEVTASVSNLVEIIAERLADLLPRLTTGLTEIVQQLIPLIPPLLQELLPAIVEGVTALIDGFISALPALMDVVIGILPMIIDALLTALPLLADAALQIVVSLAAGLAAALPELIPAAIEAILTITQGLLDNIPLLIDVAIQLVLGLIDGVIAALPLIMEMAPQIIESLIEGTLSAIPKLVDAAVQIITSLCDFILNNLPQIIQTAVELVVKIGEGLIQAIPELSSAATKIVMQLIAYVLTHIPEILKMALDIVVAIAKGLIDSVSHLASAAKEMISSIEIPFTNTEWWRIAEGIIDGMVNGIRNGISRVVDAARELARSAWEAAKDFLGIHSPSTKFEYLADMSADGYENQLLDRRQSIARAASQMMQPAYDAAYSAQASAGRISSASIINNTTTATTAAPVTISAPLVVQGNISKDTDLDALARKWGDKVAAEIRKKGGLVPS